MAREIKWHEREEKGLDKLSRLINRWSDRWYIWLRKQEKRLRDYEFLSGVDLER